MKEMIQAGNFYDSLEEKDKLALREWALWSLLLTTMRHSSQN